MARVTHASGYADAVEVVEQGDGKFSGRIEKVLELDAFQAAFILDICRQHLPGLLDGFAVKEKIVIDPDKKLLQIGRAHV